MSTFAEMLLPIPGTSYLLEGELREIPGIVEDRASRVAIGAHVKKVLAAKLHHVGDLGEVFCDFRVLHRANDA
jgi:hypothetical protein